MEASQLASLLHLSSPALPIGGFSYSQGLEAAVELGLIRDEDTALRWIAHQLALSITRCEAPVWVLLYDGWRRRDLAQIARWNSWFHVTRETHELRQETEQMGWSLLKLSTDLGWGEQDDRDYLAGLGPVTLPAAHAYASWSLGQDLTPGLTSYLFAWLENQVMAAIKSVPLGQTAGQRILHQTRQGLAPAVDEAIARSASDPPRVGNLAPMLAILSARHETQFSRLFRS